MGAKALVVGVRATFMREYLRTLASAGCGRERWTPIGYVFSHWCPEGYRIEVGSQKAWDAGARVDWRRGEVLDHAVKRIVRETARAGRVVARSVLRRLRGLAGPSLVASPLERVCTVETSDRARETGIEYIEFHVRVRPARFVRSARVLPAPVDR